METEKRDMGSTLRNRKYSQRRRRFTKRVSSFNEIQNVRFGVPKQREERKRQTDFEDLR